MSTATLEHNNAIDAAERVGTASRGKLAWLLMIPFLFFSTHGQFSFQSEGTEVGGFTPGGAAVRSPGIVGYGLAAITYLIVAWLIRSEFKELLAYTRYFKLFTGLALLAIFSTLWSQDPSRSLMYGTFYFLATLFAYYLSIRFEPKEMMDLVVNLGFIVAVLGLLIVVLLPAYGLTHADTRNGTGWIGIFTDRTGAAKCLVFFLSPALVSRGTKSAKVRWLYIALLSLMIVMSHSVTAIFVLFGFVVFLGVLRFARRLDSRLLVLFLIFGSIAAVVLTFLAIEVGPEILRAFGRNPTLTGRTVIWSALAQSILKRPLLGYGYYAFWQGLKGESANAIYAAHWTFGYAHNGILEIFLQLGCVGVFIFFLTLLKATKDAWYVFRNDFTGDYDWYIGFLLLTVLYNLDEATVVWPNDMLSILYIVACCGLALAASQLKHLKYPGVSNA